MTAEAESSSPTLRVRLMCVLAADVAGYSRLMSLDDTAALTALDASRSVFREHISSQDGRVIDMAGDSVLAVFETANGAIRAALAVQHQLMSLAANLPNDRRMLFRIGIHLGDVIEKTDGTVYGDGVNIAARLEALADAGGVSISNAVYDSVRPSIRALFEDLGLHQVRNISHPVHIYRVRSNPSANGSNEAASTSLRKKWRPLLSTRKVGLLVSFVVALTVVMVATIGPRLLRGSSTAPLLSLAVLPSKASSSTPEHLGEAFVRELTVALGKSMLGSSIIANSAVAPSSGTSTDARVIGRALNVRYVLEADLSRDRDEVVASLVLVNTEDARQVWSERLRIPAARVAEWPELPVLMSAKAVHEALWDAETRRLSRHPANEDDPMEIVFRAWMIDTSSPEGRAKARGQCEKADRLQPNLPAALICKSGILFAEIDSDPDNTNPALYQEVEKLSVSAIALASDDAMVWRLRATVLARQHQWESALGANATAIALDPEFTFDLRTRARYMVLMGRPQDALPLLRRAAEIAPKRAGHFERTACHAYLALGRYAEAVTSCEKSVSTGESWDLSVHLAVAYAQQLEQGKANAARQRVMANMPSFTIEWYRAWVLRQSDRPVYAEQYRERIEPGLYKAGFTP